VQTSTIETRIPSRLDRLPWSRFHWRVVLGLGTVWILDGLEVTIVGSVAARLTEKGSGISLSVAGVGTAAAIYVAGACLGALFFGQLTDRFGRKKLFMITLGVYIVFTTVTAFSFAPWFFYLARFFTGAGIGGEYAAINSAIDELIPARVRGRVDLIINGSYWLGSAAGLAAALVLLDTAIFPIDVGWRVAFGLGALLGLCLTFVRRKVPESPRWLFIHGQEEEAERIVGGIEHNIEAETGQQLAAVTDSIRVRQRKVISFREIGRVAFKTYPKRSILCVSLFVGQAFLYNGVTFNLGTLMTSFYGISAATVPVFIIIYAVGNLLGPLTLGRPFDTIGRKPMIAATYLGSAAVSVVLAALFSAGSLTSGSFIALVVVVFFLASAGASAAYLTASEIFPMETRALAIAFFFAIGTAVGGITGPLLFGKLIATGDEGQVAIGFLIGAAVMALGGVAELLFGVKAEGEQLEDIAKPLTAKMQSRVGRRTQTRRGVTRRSPSRARAARPPARRGFAASALARAGCLLRACPPLRHCRPNRPLTTRSSPFSACWTSTAPPNAGSWPGWWAPVTGVPACSVRRCARRSPRAACGGSRGLPSRRATATTTSAQTKRGNSPTAPELNAFPQPSFDVRSNEWQSHNQLAWDSPHSRPVPPTSSVAFPTQTRSEKRGPRERRVGSGARRRRPRDAPEGIVLWPARRRSAGRGSDRRRPARARGAATGAPQLRCQAMVRESVWCRRGVAQSSGRVFSIVRWALRPVRCRVAIWLSKVGFPANFQRTAAGRTPALRASSRAAAAAAGDSAARSARRSGRSSGLRIGEQTACTTALWIGARPGKDASAR
jgi:MFS family permease